MDGNTKVTIQSINSPLSDNNSASKSKSGKFLY